jgi:hypothetical protein
VHKDLARLIATFKGKGEANCVSRGLDRDRVVDETGGQTVVFGRRGSRPFHLNEMDPFIFRCDESKAKSFHRSDAGIYRVGDVSLKDGVLRTTSGRVLTPLATPTPSPLPESALRLRLLFLLLFSARDQFLEAWIASEVVVIGIELEAA